MPTDKEQTRRTIVAAIELLDQGLATEARLLLHGHLIDEDLTFPQPIRVLDEKTGKPIGLWR